MSKLEKLALLNIRVKPLSHSVSSTDGKGLTPQDVAHALAGLSDGPYYLARYKYAQDGTVYNQLEGSLVYEVANKKALSDWVTEYPEKIFSLVKVAIQDTCSSIECKSCGGVGYKIINTTEIQDCIVCSGTGKKAMNQSDKAEMVGISHQAWAKSWQGKYNEITPIISRWEQKISSHVRTKL